MMSGGEYTEKIKRLREQEERETAATATPTTESASISPANNVDSSSSKKLVVLNDAPPVVESTDDVKSWIKKIVTTKALKRNSVVESASVDSVDEEGTIRRKSWSFRVTPDATPNKSRRNSFEAAAGGRSASNDGHTGDNRLLLDPEAAHQRLQFDASMLVAVDELSAAALGATETTTEETDDDEPGSSSERPEASDREASATRKDPPSEPTTPTRRAEHDAVGLQPTIATSQVSSGGNSDSSSQLLAAKSPAPRSGEPSVSTPASRVALSASDRQGSVERLRREAYDRTKLRAVGDLRREETTAIKADFTPVRLKKVDVAEKPAAAPAKEQEAVVVDVAVVKPAAVPVVISFLPYEELVARNLSKQFDGLVLGELERHLDDAAFKTHFGVSKVRRCFDISLTVDVIY